MKRKTLKELNLSIEFSDKLAKEFNLKADRLYSYKRKGFSAVFKENEIRIYDKEKLIAYFTKMLKTNDTAMTIRQYIASQKMTVKEFCDVYQITVWLINAVVNRSYSFEIIDDSEFLITTKKGKTMRFFDFQEPEINKKRKTRQEYYQAEKARKIDMSKMAFMQPASSMVHDWLNDR